MQQYLWAGLLDELEVHVVPLLLGGSERLFDNLGDGSFGLEPLELVASQAAAHFLFARRFAAG